MKLQLKHVPWDLRAAMGRNGTFVTSRGLARKRIHQKEDAGPTDLCLNAHDIAAMPQLCHAKAARPAKVVQVGQHSLVMLGCAKLSDSAPAKCEVHACLQITACAIRLCDDMYVKWKCSGDLP